MLKPFLVALSLCAAGALPAQTIAPAETTLPAGTYVLDRAHASLILRVNHLGFSYYTARFTSFDATLALDPAAPAMASLQAVVDTASIETDYPGTDVDFNALLAGGAWLDAANHPEISFASTAIVLTAPDTAQVTGDLTLRGETHPVVLTVRFNGGYAGMAGLDPQARIGFSARGSLSRSEFGMGFGVPAPGSDFGVGDEVEIIIESEFLGPPLGE